jgi:acetylornithine deacetylase/succinyl-diaminopimelate desuccinylase-like protein
VSSLEHEQTREEALRLLDLLCRSPSVSAEGRELEATAGIVEELLAEAGFATRRLLVDGAPPIIFGELEGAAPYTLLLYNHYDVQPPDPLELWESPPFEPTLRDGKLFARGAADNKAELAIRLAVIRALRARHGKPPISIRWVIEGEEEIASPHFDEAVRLHAGLLRADACLWEGAPARRVDGRAVIGLGFKGLLAVRLDVRVLATDAHSGFAATVPSAPWRLVHALSTLRDPDGSVLIEGFHDAVVAPTPLELEAIEQQGDVAEEEVRKALGVDTFIGGATGTVLRTRASFSPTCNIAGLASGYSGPGIKTVLPGAASAWLDFRLVPDQRPADVLALLEAHLERHGFGDVEVTPLGSAEHAKTPLDDPFVRLVTGVAGQVSGKPPAVGPIGPATLPIVASLQRHLGMPGLGPPDNPTYPGCGAHAPNEHVKLEDLDAAIRFTHALLQTLGDPAAPSP